jgi:glutathione S-transferase
MKSLTLISHHLCPYVQRAAIALDEKGVSFDRISVDLGNKPDWFKTMSPLGKVPLLLVEDNYKDRTILFESAVILEYVEETLPNPLHPVDPLERANHRAWIEFGSACLNAIGRFYKAGDAEHLAAEARSLSDMFDRLERELGDGPWFDGASFSLVDAVYGPIFRYFDTFDAIADLGILPNEPKLRRWREVLSDRPSIKRAVADDYPERLMKFLIERQSALSERILSQGIELTAGTELQNEDRYPPQPSMSLGLSS